MMEKKMEKQFIKRLEDHNDHLSPFDFAWEILELYNERDSEGINKMEKSGEQK